jgi:membrane protease YdiL (CAAX protease family)
VIIGLLRKIWPLTLWREIDDEWLRRPEAAADSPKKEKKKKKTGPAADTAPVRFDYRPLIVMVTVAVGLTLQEYIGERQVFANLFPQRMTGEYGQLESFVWWTAWRFIGYVFLPAMTIVCMPGERLRDYFISLRGFFSKLPIYVALFLLVLPAVIIASRTASFYLTYPFYKLANRSGFDLWAWEVLYAIQFVSLEFFFRGYILKSLAPRMGSTAIFVMIVPYCMIHYGKPLPETLGAIGAGLILGTLALRTRSIWGGVLIHIGVALTMDLLAVSQCPAAVTGLRCPSH